MAAGLTTKAIEQLAELTAKHGETAIRRATAPLIARIGELESKVAVLRAQVDSKIEGFDR